MKKIKSILTLIVIISLFTPIIVYAVPQAPSGGTPPDKPDGNGGGTSSTNISYKGATTFNADKTTSKETYESTTGGQNALLVSGGTSTINSCTVTKSGDTSDENSDFYGTNAGILVYNGATLNIKEGTITTNGGHANAVFAYGTGIINLTKTTINTTGNNSGGVMVTGGGTLKATNCTVKTTGNSSASIRSDRGGGTLTVSGGTYETNGVGSPAIYSTANITVKNAKLTSTSSEGAVVEGANSIALENTELIDTNNTLNGNSETYKNIFLYQSMSGDADEGNSSFTAKDSTLTTNKGDTIFVTNTTATIELEDNKITNNDGDFLRIQKGKWGTSGSNGGNVTLKMTDQEVEGNIIVDSISTLDIDLSKESVLIGAIDNENQAKKINLTLSSDSVISLTNDSYIDTLSNEVKDNSNIYLNGYTLYVNGKKVSANNGTYSKDTTSTNNEKASNDSNDIYLYIIGSVIILTAITIIVYIIIKRRKNR